jgi:HSF-type DNA-binding
LESHDDIALSKRPKEQHQESIQDDYDDDKAVSDEASVSMSGEEPPPAAIAALEDASKSKAATSGSESEVAAAPAATEGTNEEEDSNTKPPLAADEEGYHPPTSSSSSHPADAAAAAAAEEPSFTTEVDKSAPAAPAPAHPLSINDIAYNAEFELEGMQLSFPERLMELLQSGQVNKAMDWLPDGHAFYIAPKMFFNVVLEKHFHGTKYESFTRKLNRWYVNGKVVL